MASPGTKIGRTGRLLLTAFLGLIPAVLVVSALLDASGFAAPPLITGPAVAAAWAIAAGTFGRTVTRRVTGRGAMRDVLIRITAVAGVALGAAGALARHLLPSATTAERLSWILGEEDNAQIVGIAREVLTEGPRGAGLADQFGTAFVNLPLLLARLLGGIPGEPDVRLQAIGVFTVSTLVVILLAGWSIAVLAAFPHHLHGGARARRVTLPSTLLGASAAAGATFVSLSLLVVLPMRTGFLTFVWGLTLVLVGAALVALLLVPLLWADRPRVRRSIRHRPRRRRRGRAVVLTVGSRRRGPDLRGRHPARPGERDRRGRSRTVDCGRRTRRRRRPRVPAARPTVRCEPRRRGRRARHRCGLPLPGTQGGCGGADRG